MSNSGSSCGGNYGGYLPNGVWVDNKTGPYSEESPLEKLMKDIIFKEELKILIKEAVKEILNEMEEEKLNKKLQTEFDILIKRKEKDG